MPHLRRDWAHPLPHLRRDWAHPLPHLRRDRAATCCRMRSLLVREIMFLIVTNCLHVLDRSSRRTAIGRSGLGEASLGAAAPGTPTGSGPYAAISGRRSLVLDAAIRAKRSARSVWKPLLSRGDRSGKGIDRVESCVSEFSVVAFQRCSRSSKVRMIVFSCWVLCTSSLRIPTARRRSGTSATGWWAVGMAALHGRAVGTEPPGAPAAPLSQTRGLIVCGHERGPTPDGAYCNGVAKQGSRQAATRVLTLAHPQPFKTA